MDKPQAKVTSTTSTRGACHTVPKKKCTATVCWLFSAKAKRVKKMAALSSHIRYFTGNPRSGPAIVASPQRTPEVPQPEWASFNSSPVRTSTASRRAFPGLKCGTRFSGMATLSPERGLRPRRGERRLTEKLPKPLISIRLPCTSASPIASRRVLTAYSASRWVNWLNRTARASTKSLRVIQRSGGDRNQPQHLRCRMESVLYGLTCRCCPAWRAAGRPGWSGRRFRARTAGSGWPWLLAGRRCPWP